MSLPLRRAGAALAGEAVATLGSLLWQMLTHPRWLTAGGPLNLVVTALQVVLPLLIAGALAFSLTRWKPTFPSGWFVTLVMLAASFVGWTATMAVMTWSTVHVLSAELFLIGALSMVVGTVLHGPWAVIAGWLTFYVLDRAAVKSAAASQS